MKRELGIGVYIAKSRTEGSPDCWSICFGNAKAMAAAKARKSNNAAIRGLMRPKVLQGGLR